MLEDGHPHMWHGKIKAHIASTVNRLVRSICGTGQNDGELSNGRSRIYSNNMPQAAQVNPNTKKWV